MHIVRNHTIALSSCFVLRIEFNNLWQIHRICRTVNDMGSLICEHCPCLMCHGMNDSQECVGESLSSQTLCIMHRRTGIHIPVIGFYQMLLDHFNRMNCQRIGKVAVGCGNIGLHGMCHGIHTRMCDQLDRHRRYQIRIDDCYIRCNLKIRNRIFNTLLIICDDGECGNLCCRTGCR